MARDTLRKLLIDPSSEGYRPVLAVFDLDSTLFCVSFRTQKILREYGEDRAHQKRFPKECEILKNIQVAPDDWGIRSALIREKIESTLEFFEDVRLFWHQRFFSNSYLKYDRPYEGAVEYLRELHKNKIEIRYLTGRDRIRMGAGTLEGLRQWKFPLADEAHLIMKPTHELKDEEYKTKALAQIVSPKIETYFFENEPLIINHVRRALPTVQIVFMESVHSGKADPPTDLPTLKMKFIY